LLLLLLSLHLRWYWCFRYLRGATFVALCWEVSIARRLVFSIPDVLLACKNKIKLWILSPNDECPSLAFLFLLRFSNNRITIESVWIMLVNATSSLLLQLSSFDRAIAGRILLNVTLERWLIERWNHTLLWDSRSLALEAFLKISHKIPLGVVVYSLIN